MRRPAIEPQPPPKRIPNTATIGNGDNVPPEDPTLFDHREQVQTDASGTEPDSNGDNSSGSDALRKKRGEGERKDRNAGIKLVGDIDFFPDGKLSLKDFFAEKAPTSDMDQILVLCYFLQHTVQSPQIGPGHILGGFKHVAKPVPKDLKQTIRNMKEKKAWLNFGDIETIRLTTEGENRVEHELGKGSGDAGAQ